ncbi:MAG: DUF721 domain-containing protein [Actinomycetota bacterium]|nr:DUF721 domain-containing protein [Actinomycetota bacterium]
MRRISPRGSRPLGPQTLGGALAQVRAEVAPLTLLAAVQEAWPRAVGETAAGQADPVAERDGIVTVACRSATWAQELDLLQTDLLERLREHLGEGAFGDRLSGLRFRADAARADRP